MGLISGLRAANAAEDAAANSARALQEQKTNNDLLRQILLELQSIHVILEKIERKQEVEAKSI